MNPPKTWYVCCQLPTRSTNGRTWSTHDPGFHRGWDQHGSLPRLFRFQCDDIDRPAAALVKDLKRRGLLDETLVVCGGEFGRTIYSQGIVSKDNHGRDHHGRCFTTWLAGAGIKQGFEYGKTDDYSYNILENPVHIRDLNATILNQLGVDHNRLTFRHQGLDQRLTGVEPARRNRHPCLSSMCSKRLQTLARAITRLRPASLQPYHLSSQTMNTLILQWLFAVQCRDRRQAIRFAATMWDYADRRILCNPINLNQRSQAAAPINIRLEDRYSLACRQRQKPFLQILMLAASDRESEIPDLG